MLSKILVRNLPSQILHALETLAIRHNRSTEAEARQAIQTWVEPAIMEESKNTRRKKVAERLSIMLAGVNAGTRDQQKTPSHIAEAIHEEYAEEVEDWFLGEKEPSFRQLTAIGEHFGVNLAWLKHGDSTPYPTSTIRLPEDPFEAVKWLLSWDDVLDSKDNELKTLRLIRADSKCGEFYIVKESNKGHSKTFFTPIHVSEEIGNGGEASLSALFVTLELLYKHYGNSKKTKTLVFSYLLEPTEISKLTSGQINPAAFFLEESQFKSMWWEDIWDEKMLSKNDYWEGYKQLCKRIWASISSRKWLNEQRSKIRRSVWDFVTGELIDPSETPDTIKDQSA